MTDILNLLAEDKDLIPYRKSLRKIAGSVTATILLQQMIYWGKKKNWEPFFKFKAPCNHELYQNGDSWTEELGFSIAEFDNAIKKIGTKVTRGQSKAALLLEDKQECFILYWTDSSRVTWYQINRNLLGKLTKSIYLENEQNVDSRKSDKVDLSLTEITTETTTERESRHDFLDDVFQKQGQVSEDTGPNPEDQWFEYRDKFLRLFQQLLGRYPDEIEKDEIIKIVNEPEADPGRWEQSIRETKLNFTGHKIPLARIIEVYRAGGTWKKWKEWMNNNDKSQKSELTPQQAQRARELHEQEQRELERARSGTPP